MVVTRTSRLTYIVCFKYIKWSLSYPIQSNPIQSYPILPHPILSYACYAVAMPNNWCYKYNL